MSDASARTFTEDFKRFFLRGLVILLPSVLTLWIVVKAYQFVDGTFAEPINRSVRVALINGARVWPPLQHAFDPTVEKNPEWEMALNEGIAGGELDALRGRLRRENIRSWWAQHWFMDLIGLLVAIIAVYIAGRLLGGFFGRRIYRKVEDVITSLPVFKQVYPYVKQVVDFLFSDEQPIKFNRVVILEYPRRGIWTMGFMTGESLRAIRERSGDSVSVFIPSSPTPFTGYTMTVPRSEIIELPITVEEAIRFTVSGGVLVPSGQQFQGHGPAGESGRAEPGRPEGLTPLPDPQGEAADRGPGQRRAKDEAE